MRRAVVVVVVVTGGEQSGNEGISDAVKGDLAALVKRNKDEPVKRLAEVTAIKEVNPIHVMIIMMIIIIIKNCND